MFSPSNIVPRLAANVFQFRPLTTIHFFREIVAKFGGCTATNPYSPSPYVGIWKGEAENVITAFALVPARKQKAAMEAFSRWKDELERKYRQKLILIFHYNVNTIGDL